MTNLALDLSLSGWHSAFSGISIDAFLAAMGLTGSNAGADFNAGRYWLPSLYDSSKPVECTEDDWFANFTRASEATGTNADGSLKTYAANKPTFNWSGGKRWLGNNDARTNKCTCRKHNPIDTTNLLKNGDAAATLSVVDDVAALTAAGLLGICTNGKVYKLTTPVGTYSWAQLLTSGVNASVNTQVSAFLRSPTNSRVLIGVTGGTGFYTNIPAAPKNYQYHSWLGNNGENIHNLYVILPNGGEVYFILPQYIETSFLTPVIAGDTLSAVTRAVDSCRLPSAMETVLQGSAASVLVRGKVPNFASYKRLLGGNGISGSQDDGIQTGNAATAVGLSARNSSGTNIYTQTNLGSGSVINGLAVAMAQDAAGARFSGNGGAVGVNYQPIDFSYGFIGRQRSGGYLDSLYGLIAAFPTKLSDAQLQSLSGNLSWI